MQIYYLEIVTPDVETTCQTLASTHSITFKASDLHLGGARTARLSDGGLIGVRPPLRPNEDAVIRPYLLISNIHAAVAAAEQAGAFIALAPMQLGGHGWCAIYIQGGVEIGLWQV